ncbi:ABC transporter substrate-binding protein [Pseudoroseomonas deserti]|uniref:ABC transporter substrate-binding protein n=1 Tax=Teichococcus deserti TaxID=1817963 RepID=A0A1V2GYF4_9PROT|nr:ABC transporter substrate-binding protein [Pseudoroseomonas deserti]ONG50095.1 ABC transporter substrate-binding protein [Pseudoroseomonas deserti]
MFTRRTLGLGALAGLGLGTLPRDVHAATDELRVGAQNLAPWLDPGRDFSNVGSQFYWNAFDPLIGKDHSKAESVWQPGLATSWKQVSPTEMELTLRQGVKFHDGSLMTAEDVVFSIDRIVNATFPPYTVRQRDTVPNMAKVEAVGEHVIRVTAKRPEPLFETLLNAQQLMIVPKRYIQSLGQGNAAFEAFALKPVGTGPYRIAEFVPGQRVVYERFEDFWGEKAPFRRVTVRRIPELSGRITALANNEVDLITNLPPDQLATVAGNPALRVESLVTPLFHVVIFNTQHEKMRDARLRQALSLAVDRDTLNAALWDGKAVVPATHSMPQFGPLHMPQLKTFAFDPDRAKALLKQVGYNGFPIRYDTAAMYYTNGLVAAQAIQEMWGAVGVKMELNVGDAWTGADPTMMARNWSNPMYYPDPAGCFGTMWGPTGNSVTEGRFKPDAEYTAEWDRFRYSTELATRQDSYGKLMQAIANDPPVLPLYQPYESFAMRHNLRWRPLPGHIPYVLDFRAGRVAMG